MIPPQTSIWRIFVFVVAFLGGLLNNKCKKRFAPHCINENVCCKIGRKPCFLNNGFERIWTKFSDKLVLIFHVALEIMFLLVYAIKTFLSCSKNTPHFQYFLFIKKVYRLSLIKSQSKLSSSLIGIETASLIAKVWISDKTFKKTY